MDVNSRAARFWSSLISGILRVSAAVTMLVLLQLNESVSQEIIETGFCDKLVRPKGYSCEEHKIYVDDGFALILHKMGLMRPVRAASSPDQLPFEAADKSSKMKLALGHTEKSEVDQPKDLPDEKLHYASEVDEIPVQLPFQLFGEVYGSGVAPKIYPKGPSNWPYFDGRRSPNNLPINLPPLSDESSRGQPVNISAAPEPFLSVPPEVSAQTPTFTPPAMLTPEASPAGTTSTQAPAARTPPDVAPSDWIIPPTADEPKLPPPASSQGPAHAPAARTPTSDGAPARSINPPALNEPNLSPPASSEGPVSSSPEYPGDQVPMPAPLQCAPPVVPRILPPADEPSGSTSDFSPTYTSPPGVPPAEPPNFSSDPQGTQEGIGQSVLLMHPELLNGDSWFKAVDVEGTSSPFLPFVLADEGFDVWIAHERATYWVHENSHLNSSSEEFWNWTWDEHAERDVPAMLGYICATAHTSKVHLVGVSQSAAAGAAAASRPEVVPLIKSLILIGPTIYRGNGVPLLVQTWTRVFERIMDEPDFNLEMQSAQFNISREFAVSSVSLGGPISIISGPDCCINPAITLFDNGWDGTTSLKNLRHLQQGMITNAFQHFDYGSADANWAAYGETSPPAYAPWNIPSDLPVLVVYGGQDQFSPPAGIQEFLSSIRQTPRTVLIPEYAHFDLFFGTTRSKEVYEPIHLFLLGK